MRTKETSPHGGGAMRAAVPRRDRSAHPRVTDLSLPGHPEPAMAVPTEPFPIDAPAAGVRGTTAE